MKQDDSDIKKELLKLQQIDSSVNLPITLPFKNASDVEIDSENVAREFINEDGQLNHEDMFLFQLPKAIPVNLEAQIKSKKEEIENMEEEPVYDSHGFLIKNDFENVLKSLPANSKLGKLKIYKSGKIKIAIGNNLFDVNPGISCKFAQELVAVSPNGNETVFMGKIKENRLILTPNIN